MPAADAEDDARRHVCPRPGRSGGRQPWAPAVSTAVQQPLADLAQRDRQRLLLHVGLDQRADVLQQALAELGVVGVDLPRPLGREDDQAVLAVDDLEQLVDRRVDDALAAAGLPATVYLPCGDE